MRQLSILLLNLRCSVEDYKLFNILVSSAISPSQVANWKENRDRTWHRWFSIRGKIESS